METPDPPVGAPRPPRRRAFARRNPNTVAQAPVLAHMLLNPKNWKAVLAALLHLHNHEHAAKLKNASYGTQQDRRNFLFASFRDLRAIGWKLDPRSLAERHIEALVSLWLDRGLSAGTIQDYLAYLRAFVNWIAKPGLVRKPEYYVDDQARVRRSGVAEVDKSWDGHGVDVCLIVTELAGEGDEHSSVYVDLMGTCGFRVRECVMFQPHRSLVPASATSIARPTAEWYLLVWRGTKTGRPREIPMDTPEKWRVLERAKKLAAKPDDHIGYPGLSLKQTLDRLQGVLKRYGITDDQLGVTAHGLRHQHAHGVYRRDAGVEPPVRGGPSIDPKLDTAARLKVAEELGHARKQISGAYLGGILRAKPSDEAAEAAPADDDTATNPVSQPQKEDVWTRGRATCSISSTATPPLAPTAAA